MGPGNRKSPVPPASPIEAEVRLELERIFSSSAFHGSKRCQDLLTFIVSKALDGDPDTLKERLIAVQVFGRSADANLAEDSIVRVGAREVRKRLAQYYLTDGANDPVRIELPAGSYAPAFQYQHQEPPPELVHFAAMEETPAPLPDAASPTPVKAPLWVPIASILLLASMSILVWQWTHRSPREFESFWEPALHHRGPVLVAMATPGPEPNVGFGDASAAFRLSGLLAAHSHPARVQLASKVDIAELRDSAAVLTGAFTNRWTQEITRKFRYRFALEDGGRPSIVDSQESTRRWSTENATEDFILICRIPHAETGAFVVVAAGLTQYGTQEAGRILTDADVLVPLLRQLPPDWASRNVELVLHTQVVRDTDTATAPETVLRHVW
jgi:hypothetical protein